MRPSRQIPPPRRQLVVQRFMAFVAALMLLFGQSLAVGAVQSNGGAWIEVCAGEGTKMVQTDGGAPAGDCAHCEYCTVHTATPLLGAPDLTQVGPAPVFARFQSLAVRAETTSGPAQYWAANRGPPLASEENMKIDIAFLAATMTPAYRGVSWL